MKTLSRILTVLGAVAVLVTPASAWIMPGDVDGDYQWTQHDLDLITWVVIGVIDREDLPVPAAADPTRDGTVSMYDAAWVLARM